MHSTITTIIFDIGGVLITPSEKVTPFIVSEILSMPLDRAVQAYEEAIGDLRIGKMGLVDFIDHLRLTYTPNRDSGDLEEQYKKYYVKQALIDNEMMRVVRDLSLRYRLVAFTNMIDVHIACNQERGLFGAFRDTFFSSHIGVAKPSIEAFSRVVASIGTGASACLFVDDKEENIKQATALGMQTHLFTSVVEAKGFLQKEGLL